ncbi:hypothetical protein CONPUDRAFT_164359 [Coniophora puteana RWD-64-598 SS2]|uniref:Uncharacterized protein n=1 Tax=Coniophora puteana (strain RWD-64-598) TaxID=741705 RepID=A0A5M3MXP4_CONPW|nr:uncharacterized protein CONPUDRAFT_164359 [Coniophora puteana RWD-64-598 SS2]EIW83401.1 hypothetical protein CONPUDRAFT_164359 [Coniophora puteana RWD-64-598 SS2]
MACFLNSFLRKITPLGATFCTRVGRSSEEGPVAFFEALANGIAPDCLKSLTWSGEVDVKQYYFSEWQPHKAMTFSSFHRLLVFANLTHVDLDTRRAIHLGDADLQEIACSWRHLESLFINKETGWGRGAGLRVTLDGLVTFLGFLPRLRELCVVLDEDQLAGDASQLDARRKTMAERLRSYSPPRALHTVDLLDTFVSKREVKRVGELMWGIFPRGCSVSTWG